MTVEAQAIAPVRPSRPPLRRLWAIWAGTALVLSWVIWALNGSFYARFGVPSADWPEWSLVEALLGPSALVAWAVAGVLWVSWPRRRRFAVAAVAVVVLAIPGSYVWVRHEAERARAGTPVWPSPLVRGVGGLRFSARAVTLMPLREPLPPDLPARVLLLRDDSHTSIVYDPTNRGLWWVGNQLATWSVTAGGKTWR